MKKLLLVIGTLLIYAKQHAQVNLQTGSATFSLPIFNWQDNKSRLNTVISLDYNSGNGLRVNDIASNAGQGWNLLAGGVITRMQVGEPDDQPENPGTGVNDLNKYPAGYLYSTNSPTLGCPQSLTKYPIYQAKNQLYKQHNIVAEDREQDYFSFSFNGRTGTFILGEKFQTGRSIYQAIPIGDSKLKITYRVDPIADDIRTAIRSFQITDENGLVYTYSQLGLSKVLKTNYCNANLMAEQYQPNFKRGKVYHESSFESTEITKPWIVGSWYLTDIQDYLLDPESKQVDNKVRFYYNSLDINTYTGTSFSYYAENDYSVISHLRSIGKVQEISYISYPDGHRVQFSYDNHARFDFPGEYALNAIDIVYDSRSLSRFTFHTGYVIKNRFGTPLNDQQKNDARLYLKSVEKTGVDLAESDLPYVFDYYLGTGDPGSFVPPPYFYAKDIWGFYNGDESRDYTDNSVSLDKTINELSNDDIKGLCFIKRGQMTSSNPPAYENIPILLRSKKGFAANGLLRQVMYPTGGSIHYEYEQNEAELSGNAQTDVGGVHVLGTKVTDGGFSNDCGHPLTTVYQYTTEGSTTQSSLWGAEMPDNKLTTKNHYEPEHKRLKYKRWFTLGCFYKYQYPGLMQKEQIYMLNFQQQIVQTAMELLDIVTAVQTVIDIVKYLFFSGPVSGVIMAAIGILLNIAITCLTSQEQNTETTTYYNSSVNSSNPLPSQYGRVEATESPGGKGKTVYEFTSPADYAVWETDNATKSMKQRFAYWAYGLPKRTALYDNSATPRLVKETVNEYDWSKARNQFINSSGEYTYNSCRCNVVGNSSQRNTTWEIPPAAASGLTTNNSNEQKVEVYHASTGRVQLSKTTEKLYKPDNSGQAIETVTDYEYDDNNYQVKSVTSTNSNGDITNKQMTYSADYTAADGSIFGIMNNSNLVAVPISTYIQKKEAGATTYSILGESVTEFTTVAGQLKPSRSLEKRFATPQPASSVQLYHGIGTTYTPAYSETQTFQYDAVGNLKGMKDEGNHTITNIYDYNDKYVVASVVNADPETDTTAYTSFETEVLGGWSHDGTPAYTAGGATGKRSYALGTHNDLSKKISSSRQYIVSFWHKSGTPVVDNSNLVKTGPVINGYEYSEYLTNAGAVSVSLTGNATIDELRLYPETARMRTVTYDPLIGKTCECDENNRISYYEYDAQGRLRFIKDDKQDVVKMYEYNTTQRQQGCPVLFFNPDIDVPFTKDKCEPREDGQPMTGGTYIYHIPAHTYTSTVSQEEVDRQVQQELATQGQAAANNNAGCLPLFSNKPISREFVKETCGPGYIGPSIVYTVAKGTYTSTVSQQDADEQALDELEANGQVFANNNPTLCTTIDNEPDWEADEDNPQTQCGNGSNGAPVGHIAVLMTDINPNSPTQGHQEWRDGGEDASCGIPLYFPAMQGGCIGNGQSQSIIHGNVGDNVTVEVVFSGTLQWNQLYGNSVGAGPKVQVSIAGSNATNIITRYTGTGPATFTTTASLSFTMYATTVTITTTPILYNSTNNNNNTAQLRVTSVNGTPRTANNAAYVCTGNQGGIW